MHSKSKETSLGGPSSGCRVQMGGAGLARPPGATDGVALDPQTAPEPRRPERRRGEIRGVTMVLEKTLENP